MFPAETDDGRHVAPDETIPVVITGADLAGGLGLARALRALGVPIYGLAADKRSPCCRSSAWTEVCPVDDDSERAWIEALLKLSIRHRRQVLFSVKDTVVDIISRNREVLSRHYLFVLPDHPIVQMQLADKSAFARWAETHGFPVRELVSCRLLMSSTHHSTT